jgi:hypothetical protein
MRDKADARICSARAKMLAPKDLGVQVLPFRTNNKIKDLVKG